MDQYVKYCTITNAQDDRCIVIPTFDTDMNDNLQVLFQRALASTMPNALDKYLLEFERDQYRITELKTELWEPSPNTFSDMHRLADSMPFASIVSLRTKR